MLRAKLTFWVLVFAGITSLAAFAADDRRDGNWWIGQQRVSKLDYVIGYFDGIIQGHYFSIWNFKIASNRAMATADQQAFAPYASKSEDDYQAFIGKYVSNTTTGQLVDGLDSFYADYKNRRILAVSAMWLVMNGIAGVPQDELNKMAESFRKNS